MMLPTIHLNGTSQDSLLEQFADASEAVRVALQDLQQAAPHGRDYYPQGPEAFGRATAEHRKRVDALVGVRHELETIIEGILG